MGIQYKREGLLDHTENSIPTDDASRFGNESGEFLNSKEIDGSEFKKKTFNHLLTQIATRENVLSIQPESDTQNIVDSEYVDEVVALVQDAFDERALYNILNTNPDLLVELPDGSTIPFLKYVYNLDTRSSYEVIAQESGDEADQKVFKIREELKGAEPNKEQKLDLAFNTLANRIDLESYIKMSPTLENGLSEAQDSNPYSREELLILIDGLWKGEFGIDNLPRAHGFRECVYRIMAESLRNPDSIDQKYYEKPSEIHTYDELKGSDKFKKEGDEIVYEYDRYLDKTNKVQSPLNKKIYNRYKEKIKKFLGLWN
jgi:hypothetical protein